MSESGQQGFDLGRLTEDLESGNVEAFARQVQVVIQSSTLSVLHKVDLRNLIFRFKDKAYAFPDLLLIWARLEIQLGFAKVGYDLLAQLLNKYPNHLAGLREMGYLCASTIGSPTEALRAFELVTRLDPQDWSAWNDGGCILRSMGRLHEAIAWMEKACKISPPQATLYANLALLHYEGHRLDIAQEILRKALEIDPNNPEALHTQGMLSARLGQLDLAYDFELRALAIKPDYPQVRLSLALLDLTTGQWEKGFAGYESRWVGSDRAGAQKMPTIYRPRWAGQPVYPGSRIAVLPEQGLGDALQFARFIQDLLKIFQHVDWVLPQSLIRLMENSFKSSPGLSFHLSADSLPLHLIDYECPIMSLPLSLGVTVENLPKLTGYLKPSASAVERFKPLLDEIKQPLKVGLAWSGRPTLSAHALRMVSPELLQVLDHPDIAFVNLQKSETGPIAVPKMQNWYDCMAHCQDFDDTAALASQLDLIISTDTSIAHLVGALGKPVWLLNRKGSEWRWMTNRTDSPWYPSMTLFNQARALDWKPELEKVSVKLRGLVSETR